MRTLPILLLAFLFSGCGLITKWEDVSYEGQFPSLVGSEHLSKVDLIAHGVTMDRNYAEVLDHYALYPLPGIVGPEILSRNILAKGTNFKILRIIRCVDCLLKREEIEFKYLTSNEYDGAPIRMDYKYFQKHRSELFE